MKKILFGSLIVAALAGVAYAQTCQQGQTLIQLCAQIIGSPAPTSTVMPTGVPTFVPPTMPPSPSPTSTPSCFNQETGQHCDCSLGEPGCLPLSTPVPQPTICWCPKTPNVPVSCAMRGSEAFNGFSKGPFDPSLGVCP